jgi:hypothetical protein
MAELEGLEAAGGTDGVPELTEGSHVREDRHGGIHGLPEPVHAAQEVDDLLAVRRHIWRDIEDRTVRVEGAGEVQHHLMQGDLADLMHGDEQVLVLRGGHGLLAREQRLEAVVAPVVVVRRIHRGILGGQGSDDPRHLDVLAHASTGPR